MVYHLGVAWQDGYTGAPQPLLFTSKIYADTFEEARQLFLNDPFVQKGKLNDEVMLIKIGSEVSK